MTVKNSVREIFTLPVTDIVNGASSVIGYNYGAKQYDPVRGTTYTMLARLLVILFPT